MAGVRQRRMIGDDLKGRHNSLNFIRLILATMVVISHAADLGSFPHWSGTLNSTSVATMAVYGFFGISGYLIAGSVVRNAPGRYLWQRVLRIFPGLWLCLLVTGLVFGVLAWRAHPIPGCTWSCYFNTGDGPWPYFWRNASLPGIIPQQIGIAGTPRGVLLVGIWNGSLWTLAYEFIAYLILLALSTLGMLRHRIWTVLAAVGLAAIDITITGVHGLSTHFNAIHNVGPEQLIRLTLIFLVGSLIYLYRDRVPDSGWLALILITLFFADMMIPNGPHKMPAFQFTVSNVLAPTLVYPLLWVSIHLPPSFQKVGATNDISYGVYVYGYPVTQLLVMWHAPRLGVVPYLVLCCAVTACFGAFSWFVIEERSLRLRKRSWPSRLSRSPSPERAA